MGKIKIISNGMLDSKGWKKIGKSFAITLGAAAIGFIANLVDVVDFGSLNSIALILLPWVANTLRVWLFKYESS